MVVVEYHGIELDYCASCHGTWFDRGELQLLLRSMELEDSAGILNRLSHQQPAASTEKKLKCPICYHRMLKYHIGNDPQVLVDTCPQEDGIWFDAGEIHQLMASLSDHQTPGYGSEHELLAFLGEVFEAEEQP
jgi:Zn-finger nucleic acid-binding protein